MDLKSLDVVSTSERGIEVVIVNPKTAERTDFVVTVKGIYSKQFSELIGRAAQRMAKAKQAPEDPDLMAKVLAQVTIGWKGLTEDGKEVPFSQDTAERVYGNPIIRKQVWDAAVDEGNLIPG